jgi:hypothetical protein
MLLFLDESGTDQREAPYEVLAGVALRERALWPLIQAIRAAERDHFGTLLSAAGGEFKGKKLLKPKVFRFAEQGDLLSPDRRRELAAAFLAKGQREASGEHVVYQRDEFTAWGQAVLAFVREVYALSAQFGAKVFASLVACDAPRPTGDFLRQIKKAETVPLAGSHQSLHALSYTTCAYLSSAGSPPLKCCYPEGTGIAVNSSLTVQI